ncbi:MAG: serine hydrolase domain-containing protein [Solirubrobacteraceae bacterium]
MPGDRASEPDARHRAASPEAVGLSSSQLRRLDEHLAAYVAAGRLPGAVVLVARQGQVAHVGATGMADVERRVPIGPDTIFRVYSMTKPLTAVALLQLYESGAIRLDDLVDEYLPGWRELEVRVSGSHPTFVTRPPNRPMVVADLLSHQSGLAYGLSATESEVDRAYAIADPLAPTNTLVEMVDVLAGLPLAFSPGERWKYSIATDVCARIVEIISCMPFDEYLRENVIDPLGMRDTGFSVPPGDLSRLAAGYRVDPAGLTLVDDPQQSRFAVRPALLSGGGGLVSTVTDYWRFSQALCNGGTFAGERVLGRKTVDLMASNHLTGGADLATVALGRWGESSFAGVGFGLGVAVTLDPAATRVAGSSGEFSWGGMAGTAFFVDRAEQLVVILMTQATPSSAYPIRRELRAIAYSALE